MARALRAYRDGTGDAWDWSGALVIADAIEDMRILRMFKEASGGLKLNATKN